jgi:hypothetical protein
MPVAKLNAALTAVDWNKNVATFLASGTAAQAIAKANLRIAIWSKQLENADKGNPALCFVREMQMAGSHVAALVALALYKPAAASMRAMLETGLYYTYFRTHHSELATLVRSPGYFVDKRELIDYHKQHTDRFTELQGALGLVSRLEKWYSNVSAVVHGQIPGTWIEHKALANTAPIDVTEKIVVAEFLEGTEVLHRLFLCTAGRLLWDGFSSQAKKELLHGLPGSLRMALKLDIA